jgi:hypothetical protein
MQRLFERCLVPCLTTQVCGLGVCGCGGGGMMGVVFSVCVGGGGFCVCRGRWQQQQGDAGAHNACLSAAWCLAHTTQVC